MFYVLRETLSVILRKSGGVSLFVFGGEKKMTHSMFNMLLMFGCSCISDRSYFHKQKWCRRSRDR